MLYYPLYKQVVHVRFALTKLNAYHLTTHLTTKPSALAEICEELWRGRKVGSGMVIELRTVKESYRCFPLKIPTMKPID